MLDLICYVFEGWKPNLRPAPQERDWMDETPNRYAYRCLPLSIANSHGWQLLCPIGFDVYWRGGGKKEDLIIKAHQQVEERFMPVSIFGEAVLTFHVDGIFRTPPGFNLYITGTPNSPKEGIYPLTGIVETDWAPFTFTMNWKLLRRNHIVRFEKGEPFCFIFPIRRETINEFNPKIAPIDDDPELKRQYATWEKSRNEFHRQQQTNPSRHMNDTWQKNYFQGRDMDNNKFGKHINKLRLSSFTNTSNLTHTSE